MMFLLRKPSVLFAFLEMRFMCVSHDRSKEMSTNSFFPEDNTRMEHPSSQNSVCTYPGCLQIIPDTSPVHANKFDTVHSFKTSEFLRHCVTPPCVVSLS